MNNGVLGHIGIVLGLLGAAGGCVTGVIGLTGSRPQMLRRLGRYGALVLVGSIIATVAMEHALITHDFSLAFVAGNNARETPLFFSITGMWSGLQGSILLWVLILSAYLCVCLIRFKQRLEDQVVAWAMVVIFAVATFFFALMVGPADPFAATIGPIPIDGAGANALLQDNTLVAIHPPFLYLGFVGFTVPYAFAIGSLITGRVGEQWLTQIRRFAVFAWAFLTIGIVLGSWWSYQTLGWGGFWGWDPVENAALLPWLTGTAYLHSVMVQERRGLLRIWNLSLLIATFSLTILGTFLTRSGITASVHTFSDSGIGPVLLAFFGVVVFTGLFLIGLRGDRLKSPGTIDSPVSREGAFLVNNLLFAAFALVVLIGTVFPLFVQAINNQSITIGRPYFDTFTVPIGIALLFFMAIAPALPWRKASAGVLSGRLIIPAWAGVLVVVGCVIAGVRGFVPLVAFGLGAFAASSAIRQLVLAAIFARKRGLGIWRGLIGRANGGMIVHIGIVVMAIGLTAASSFDKQASFTLHPGQTVSFDGHVITLVSVNAFTDPNRSGNEAVIRLDHRGLFRPAIDVFTGDTEGVSTPSISSSLFQSVYFAPSGALTTADPKKGIIAAATFDVVVQSLVVWMWSGAAIVVLGACLAAIPGRRQRRPTDPSSVPLPEFVESSVTASVGQAV